MSCRRQTGLSLLELVLAMFLFATLVPLFAGVWTMSHRQIRKDSAHSAANQLCHLLLEQAIAAGYGGVDALAATPLEDRVVVLRKTIVDSSRATPTSSSQDREYSWSMTVQTPAANPALMTGEKLVEVVVNWREGSDTKTTQMSTLLTEGSNP